MANYYLGHTGEELDEAIRRVLSGELNVPLQEKRVTPTTSEQIVAPDSDYKGLSRVTVEGIPQSYTDEVYNQGYEAGYNAEKPYQVELDYIESTGTQYIDTGFKHNQDTRVVMDAQVTKQPNTHAWLFEGRNKNTTNHGVFLLNGTTWNSDYKDASDGRHAFTSVGVTDRLNIDYNKNVVNLNGYNHTYTVQTFQSNYNLALFAANTDGTIDGYISARVYSCQIYDNGTLVRDYIPVLDSEGIPCLYDKVNKTFTYNAGTGTFKYPGSTPVVNSITTTGSYDSASYHGDYWAAIDNNGTLLLVVNGGTNTSYESIYFTTSSIPSGVTFLKQSYYSYASMSVSVPYVAVFSGITSSVDITLNFSGINSSSDYTTCTVTITYT